MDEKVGAQNGEVLSSELSADQTRMGIHTKHADVKFYMLKKKKHFLLFRKVAAMYHKGLLLP